MITGLFATTSGLRFESISVHGSSAPGAFAAFEWILRLTLRAELPDMAAHLPKGVKVGDEVRWVGVSLLWWNEEGKVKRQTDHGRLAWEGFEMESIQ